MGETAGGRTWSWVHAALRVLFDLVFPPRCAGCQTAGSVWCPACDQRLKAQTELACVSCHTLKSGFNQIICSRCAGPTIGPPSACLGAYADPLRSAIVQLKYWPDPFLADELAWRMAESVCGLAWQPTCVAAVPLHPERAKQRGFNQAETLAGALARRLSLPHLSSGLRRIRHTRSQVGLDRTQRWINVRDAFAAEPTCLAGERVLLVDDLRTTGATLRACATAAAAAGAIHIDAFTLAATAAGDSATPVGEPKEAR